MCLSIFAIFICFLIKNKTLLQGWKKIRNMQHSLKLLQTTHVKQHFNGFNPKPAATPINCIDAKSTITNDVTKKTLHCPVMDIPINFSHALIWAFISVEAENTVLLWRDSHQASEIIMGSKHNHEGCKRSAGRLVPINTVTTINQMTYWF